MQPIEAAPMIQEREVLKRVRLHYLYRALMAIGLVFAFIVMFSLVRALRPALSSSHVWATRPPKIRRPLLNRVAPFLARTAERRTGYEKTRAKTPLFRIIVGTSEVTFPPPFGNYQSSFLRRTNFLKDDTIRDRVHPYPFWWDISAHGERGTSSGSLTQFDVDQRLVELMDLFSTCPCVAEIAP